MLDVLGAIGLILIVVPFILHSMSKMKRKNIPYNLSNCLGGYILAVYSFYLGSWVFLILQILWGTVSLYFLIKVIRK